MKNNNDNDKKESLAMNLQSEDLKIARAAITKIRKTGRLVDVPSIIEAYRIQRIEAIRKEIHTLLCDIQLEGSVELIINAIKDEQNNSIIAGLLGICWESKQDFSNFLDLFVTLFLNQEYLASIEAFTIIEKIFLDYKIPDKKLQATMRLIKTSYPDLSESKRELALLLIDSLENQQV